MPVTLVVLPKNHSNPPDSRGADSGHGERRTRPDGPNDPVPVPGRGAFEQTLPEGETAVTFEGTRIVLGRGASSDLVLPDASVSLRHASIRTSGAEYVLLDEGSTNGTFCGETRLTPNLPKPLKNGERIRLGRIWVEVRIGAAAVTRDVANTTRDLALAMVAEMLVAGGGDTTARVEVQGGPDGGATLRLAIEARHYIVGRGEACDLKVADPDCSREHVIFLRRGAQTFVVDLGSKNGSYLGSHRLAAHVETRVHSGRLVQVGRTVLLVEEPAELALAGLENVSDEVLGEGDVPLAPPVSSRAKPHSGSHDPPASRADIPPQSTAAIAEVPRSLPRPPEAPPSRRLAPRKGKGISAADVVVVLVALSLIGLSVAGLYWIVGPGK